MDLQIGKKYKSSNYDYVVIQSLDFGLNIVRYVVYSADFGKAYQNGA